MHSIVTIVNNLYCIWYVKVAKTEDLKDSHHKEKNYTM